MKRVVRVDLVVSPPGMPDTDEATEEWVAHHMQRCLGIWGIQEFEITSVEQLADGQLLSDRAVTPPTPPTDDADISAECVNCHEPVTSPTPLRLRIYAVSLDESDVLWERPLCVECESTQAVGLLQYVRLALQ